MSVAAIGGAVIGVAGTAYASSRASKGAKDAARAAQLQPFAAQTPFGAASINRGNLQVDGGFGAGLAPGFEQFAGSALNAANSTGFQQSLSLDPTEVLRQALGQGQGANAAFQNASANFLGASGQSLGGVQNFDADAFASNRFAQLQELAGPAEDNAASSLANRLFSAGRLGGQDSASGRGFGELAQAQARSRTERGILSQQAAQQELSARIGQAGQLQGFAGNAGLQGGQIAAGQLGNFGQALQVGFGAQGGNIAQLQGLLGLGAASTQGIQDAFAPTRSALQALFAGSELQQSGTATAANALSNGANSQAALIGNTTAGLVQGLGNFARRNPAQTNSPAPSNGGLAPGQNSASNIFG